jgi:ferrous iron transport protein B
MRTISFLKDAIPYMLLGVFIVNFLYTLGVFEILTQALGPAFNTIFGLPKEAISALLMGFLRKYLAMGMLTPLNLTAKQLVVASTVLAVYFPCVATFMVLIRELGVKDMFKSSLIMIATAVLVGGFINYTFSSNSLNLTGYLIIIIVLIMIKYIPNLYSKKEHYFNQ